MNYFETKSGQQAYLEQLQIALKETHYGKEYFNACLNYAKRLLDNRLPVIFDPVHLSRLLGLNEQLFPFVFSDQSAFYRTLSIPKKSGGERELAIPSARLKQIQRWILDTILNYIPVSPHATGFSPGCSIVKNATAHLGNECIISIDIKDFFPSIHMEDVFRIFYYYGYTKELSFAFARLCCFCNSLPQGSPASPAISNIRCLKLDKRISALCQKQGAVYTRYADDITISGSKCVRDIMPTVYSIIEQEGFIRNERKDHTAFPHQRQSVTGLTVNSGQVRVPKKYKRQLKQEIYYCQKYGPWNHQKYIGDSHAFFREHLYGKALFVLMVEPDLGRTLLDELDKINWDT